MLTVIVLPQLRASATESRCLRTLKLSVQQPADPLPLARGASSFVLLRRKSLGQDLARRKKGTVCKETAGLEGPVREGEGKPQGIIKWNVLWDHFPFTVSLCPRMSLKQHWRKTLIAHVSQFQKEAQHCCNSIQFSAQGCRGREGVMRLICTETPADFTRFDLDPWCVDGCYFTQHTYAPIFQSGIDQTSG